MKKQFKLGIIGCGHMVQTILKGVVLSDFLHEKKIIVSDASEERLDEIVGLGVHATLENRYVAENSEFVVLAVNSEAFEEAAKTIAGVKIDKLISIMQGVTINSIKNKLGLSGSRVARCIMNTACSVGSGVIGIDMSDYNGSTADTEFISNAFNCLGTVLSTDESKLNAVEAVGGCGPAYSFMFIDALVDAGVKLGLSRDEAKILVIQSLIGAVDMLDVEGGSISEFIVKASKGNTAIEAVKVFEKNNFRGIVSEGVDACAKRLRDEI